MLFISSVIAFAICGITWAPSSQYTLYPLYSGGLWLAVITIPAIVFKFLTAKDNSGVVLKESNIYAFIPQAANVFAASIQNSLDICLLSWAITTPLFFSSSVVFFIM